MENNLNKIDSRNRSMDKDKERAEGKEEGRERQANQGRGGQGQVERVNASGGKVRVTERGRRQGG